MVLVRGITCCLEAVCPFAGSKYSMRKASSPYAARASSTAAFNSGYERAASSFREFRVVQEQLHGLGQEWNER